MSDLLPCPFCGGEAKREDIEAREGVENAGASYITCGRCWASTALHFDRKENLVSSWNDRHLVGVAEQSGAGAPETSVRCGAPIAQWRAFHAAAWPQLWGIETTDPRAVDAGLEIIVSPCMPEHAAKTLAAAYNQAEGRIRQLEFAQSTRETILQEDLNKLKGVLALPSQASSTTENMGE